MYKDNFSPRLREWMRALDALPDVLGKETMEWVDSNFVRQGWQGARFEPWANKRPKRGKRNKVLIDRNRLRSSGQAVRMGARSIRVTYGNSIVTYARVHNEGLTVTQRVPAHQRRGRSGRKHAVVAHSRTVSYPRNQFVGDSPHLRAHLYKVIREELRL